MKTHYSHHSGYTVPRRTARRPAVRTVQRRVRFGPTTAKFFGLAVLAVLAILMLAQRSNTDATQVYKQGEIQNQISQVKETTDQLELEAQRAKTLQAIQQTSQDLHMTPAVQADQVAKDVSGGSVAGVSTQKP